MADRAGRGGLGAYFPDFFDLDPRSRIATGAVCTLVGCLLTWGLWESGWAWGYAIALVPIGIGLLFSGVGGLRGERAARQEMRRARAEREGLVVFGIAFLALLWVVVIAGFVFHGCVSIGCGFRELRVRARLVESGSDAPLAGARVLPVSAHDLTHGWNPEETWSFLEAIGVWAEAHGDAPGPTDGPGDRGTRSCEDGTVDLVVELWTCTRSTSFGSCTSTEEPEDKVAALWVAVEGRAHVVVRIETADLRLHARGPSDAYWATYDLGPVDVPVGASARR